MQAHPRPSLLDRRARARLWLLAPLLGASAVAVVVTAEFPPLPVVAVCVAFALGGWLAVWAVRDLALPDPSSLPRPVTGADLLTSVSTVQVIAPARMPRIRPYDDELLGTAEDVGVYVPRHACHTPTSVIPQVTA